MVKRFIKQINKLKQTALDVSTMAEEAVYKSIKALQEHDVDLANEVVIGDDAIDQAEVDLEEECLKVLALYQPVAIDLRLVVAILKINSDLERIGDLASNIADRGKRLAESPLIDIPYDFPKMAAKVQEMLRNSLDSLMKLDVELATKVLEQDEEVDEMHKEVYVLINARISKNPDEFSSLINYLTVSTNLERIADHATNIAEDVIYLLEGFIIRHQGSF